MPRDHWGGGENAGTGQKGRQSKEKVQIRKGRTGLRKINFEKGRRKVGVGKKEEKTLRGERGETGTTPRVERSDVPSVLRAKEGGTKAT